MAASQACMGDRFRSVPGAIKLDKRNIESPMGGRWMSHHLMGMAVRLGINHPVARISPALARARVYEICKQHSLRRES
jgi:hypothetical protein